MPPARCETQQRAVTTQPRSYLFVPGDRPERIAKARASGADAVIVDLEDAVAPANKVAARDATAAALDATAPVVLRINGADTAWFADDARLAAHPGVAAVLLPKAASTEPVAALRSASSGKPVLALIESAAGMANLAALAATPGVTRLVFGSIDFQLDLDIADDDLALLAFRSQLVLASRVANLPAPVDGVTTAIDDVALIELDARRARSLGFGAKLCIHPRQVTIVNGAFSPSEAELSWAQRVVDAAAAAGGAAVAVDGKMVDAPVLARARRLLAARRG
jgi:citrate lyase subunit beta/citryl-CoA lyase